MEINYFILFKIFILSDPDDDIVRDHQPERIRHHIYCLYSTYVDPDDTPLLAFRSRWRHCVWRSVWARMWPCSTCTPHIDPDDDTPLFLCSDPDDDTVCDDQPERVRDPVLPVLATYIDPDDDTLRSCVQIQMTTLCVTISLSAYVTLFCLYSPHI